MLSIRLMRPELERRKSVRFLRKNAERTSLFGVIKFAETNPDTFMTLLNPHGQDTSNRLWSMELLAQLYFSGLAGHDGQVVFLDEGLVHRGMSCLALSGTKDDAQGYALSLKFEHALVLLDCSVDMAMARCAGRPGGVPGAYAHEGGAPDRMKFERFAELLAAATDELSANGASILRLDASRPATDLGAELADWVKLTMSPAR